MSRVNWTKISISIMIIAFLSGCWDSEEIQQRTLIFSIAIDKPTENDDKKRYEMTIQIAEPIALSEKPIPGTEPVWNLSSTCDSIFECVRINATKVSRPGYYGHLQVILIGEELAREEGLDKSLDLFFRDHEMRRRTKIVIVKGKAKEAIKLEHPLIPILGEHIANLTEEARKKTAQIPMTATLGQFSKAFQSGADILLPSINIEGNFVVMSGGALIKKGKLIDFVSGEDVKANRVLMGTATTGVYFSAPYDPEKKDELPFTFEIKGMKSKINSTIIDDIPHFNIEILMEGNLAEDAFSSRLSKEKLKKMEDKLSEKLEEDLHSFITKMQEQYKSDVCEFGEEVRRHHYEYWKKSQKDWDNIFAEAKVNLKVHTYIRRYGRIKQ